MTTYRQDIDSPEYADWLDREYKVRYSRAALKQVPINSPRGRKIAAGLVKAEAALAQLWRNIPQRRTP